MTRTIMGPVVNKSGDGEKLAEFQLNKADKNKKKKSKDSPVTVSPVKFLVNDSWECKKCKKPSSDSDDEQWMECDSCTGRFHRTCTNLSVKQFSFLHDSPHDDFKWFCSYCQKTENKLDPNIAMILGELTKIVQNLQQQNVNLANQNSMILDMLKGKKGIDEQIKIHVEEVLVDQKEKEEKKNNIIVYNLPEGTEEDDSKNTDQDLIKAKEVLEFVNPDVSLQTLDSSRIKRIGSKRKGNDTKPRPIKVVMDSQDSKMDILRNSRKLRNLRSSRELDYPLIRLKENKNSIGNLN